MSTELHSTLLNATAGTQYQSPLFRLPAEIRYVIFDLCVTECEDRVKRYPRHALWNRPGHTGPRTTYTEVLQTCKLAYQEGWFLPLKNTSLTIYLTAWDRRPAKSVNPFVLEEQLSALDEPVVFNNLQIFAQLYMLEPGMLLQQILDLPNFLPRTLTITVRHTDFWNWESDATMCINGQFVNNVEFPDSLEELVVHFETVDRKKGQADSLAIAAASSWIFRRKDRSTLRSSASTGITNSSWTGSSTLNVQRYLRDEARPGQIDYYITSVTFKHCSQAEADPGNESGGPASAPNDQSEDAFDDDGQTLYATASIDPPPSEQSKDPATITADERRKWPHPAVNTSLLKKLGMSSTTPQKEVYRRLGEWRAKQQAERIRRYEAREVQSDNDSDDDADMDLDWEGIRNDQVPASREEDEVHRAEIIDEQKERAMDLFFLPGSRDSYRTLKDGRFGGQQSGFEYQYWKGKYWEWRKAAKDMDEKHAGRLRTQMLPFYIPSQFEDPNASLGETREEMEACIRRELDLDDDDGRDHGI